MSNELTVKGKMIEMRSDHLLAVFEYALQQAADSCIDVLDFGRNEQDLDSDEQLEWLQDTTMNLRVLTMYGHQPLFVVKPDWAQVHNLQKQLDNRGKGKLEEIE